MTRPLRVLIAEDRPTDAELMIWELRHAGFAPESRVVDNEDDFAAALHPDWEVILSDFTMPGFSAYRALALLQQSGLEIPFIIVSGSIGEETAVASMKLGATDYLLKDRLARLGPAVEHALQTGKLRRERKTAEAALRDSEERFRQMAETIADVFWMTDVAKNEMLYVSPAYEKIWGRTCLDLYASPRNWLDAIHPDDRAGVLEAALSKQVQGTYDEEYRIVRQDGSIRWIRDRAFPVTNAAGKVHRVVGVARDITPRKQAEERLREQAAMLDHAHDAIVVRDIHTRKVTFWNKGAERLYGWKAEEAAGQDIGELIFADAAGPDRITQALLEDGEWRGEVNHITRASRQLVVSCHATLVRDSCGVPRSALVIYFDITEQKDLERRFLRAQRMESIGTLASGIAHDLNNILSPIMMSAPLLRGDMPQEMRDEIVDTIEMSAERGAQIVKQVLTFGRGLEGEKVPLPVETLIKEIIKISFETFPRSITLSTSIEPDLPRVLGDATQIHQILLNLCVNARDAMPAGGKLRLRASTIDVDPGYASMLPDARPGRFVLVQVSDTGSGIPAEILERIFDPFFTTKGIGHGTGLGLSTVLGIVKSHDGFLHVNSLPGEGTTFHVYLPVASDEDAAPAAPSLDLPPSGQGELVLVVDDEPRIAAAARLILERHGYRVVSACDGTEAVAAIARDSVGISAMLTDLMMPVMDGMALIRAVRRITPALPVLASSGLGEKTQLAELKALGVGTVLTKPYSADSLLRALHALLHPASP
ncbi:MAG: PAS domain S-box protein [Chthoniobacteraceae bacterium]